jgi:hypothetical protein
MIQIMANENSESWSQQVQHDNQVVATARECFDKRLDEWASFEDADKITGISLLSPKTVFTRSQKAGVEAEVIRTTNTPTSQATSSSTNGRKMVRLQLV